LQEITETNETSKAPPPAEIVDVRFRVPGRAATFQIGNLPCKRNAAVVVQTERGSELGEAIGVPRSRFPKELDAKFPRVLRLATDDDLARAEHNHAQEKDAGDVFRDLAQQLGLPLKLLRVDYRFDGGKAAFYFMSTKGRVEHRGLARDLAQKLHTRVEMRQIGERDEARLTGGMGPCGRELCCSSWLKDFAPVSIKHAKEQGLSLNPGKLAGMCGRLKCCLRYEYDTYAELRRGLPRIGKKVNCIHGEGVVTQQIILKQQVVVRRFSDEMLFDCSLEDLVEKKAESAATAAELSAPGQETHATTSPKTEAPQEISEWEAASTPDPTSREKRNQSGTKKTARRRHRKRGDRNKKPSNPS
jgi:cell fate regulator YaaT (PSP1 superfamily)